MTTLIIVAHPDDEILGCGGTAARLAAEGEAVVSLILGEGIASRYPEKSPAVDAEIAGLHQRTTRAAEIIGITETIHTALPDNRFDTLPLLEVIRPIETVLDTIRPDTVFTHHAGDLNIDHRVVSRAVLTATRPIAGNCVKTIYACEIPSSTDWTFNQGGGHWRPAVYFDISRTLETKILALKEYDSEIRPHPHPRSYRHVRESASCHGAVIGREAAEAFELIRSIR